MILARIDGVIVSSVCHPSMNGCRTVICQPVDEAGREEGAPILALDPLSAGRHQQVLISTDGSKTRVHVGDPMSPLRNIILAIVDEPERETT
jgi:ethanolamine utilization protein EutN